MTTPPPPRLVPDRPSDAAIAAEFWKRWTSTTIHLEAAHELQRIHDDAKAIDAAAPPAEAPAERGEAEELAKRMDTEAALLVGCIGRNDTASDVVALREGAAMIRQLAAAPAGEVSAMDAIVAAFNTWPDDLRKKLSLHDLRRMTGWRPAAPAAPAEGVMGWATPDGRVCSARDKAMALVQDASAYTIALAPRVTGGRESTGHCANKKQPGGCHLHNLQCGYPDCDRRPA